MNFGKWLVHASLGLSLAGCGTGTEPQTEEELGTLDGELLDAPVDYHHTWSLGVCAGPLNEDPAKGPVGTCLTAGTRCTGSLIARDLVLTARHCVHEIDYSSATSFCTGKFTSTPISTAPVRVTPSISTIVGKPVWYEVEKVLTSSGSQASCEGDLAILKLKKPVPFWVARPVRVDVRELTQHKPAKVAVVGRGVIEQTFDVNTYAVVSEKTGNLLRRVLQNIPFVCVSNTEGDCVAPDIGGPFVVDPGYAQIGRSTASGDSGAGIARQGSFPQQPTLIGVNSAGTADPVTGKVNFGFATRLDRHRQFILGALTGSGPSSAATAPLQ